MLRVLLRKSKPVQSPIAADANDKLLGRVDDNDPLLKCFLDYARSKFDDRMNTAMDLEKSDDERMRNLNAAVGLRQFIEEFEATREQAKELRKRELEEEKQK